MLMCSNHAKRTLTVVKGHCDTEKPVDQDLLSASHITTENTRVGIQISSNVGKHKQRSNPLQFKHFGNSGKQCS